MPCFYPLTAFQTVEGEIHFYQRGTQGKSGAKAPNYRRDLTLPCGRCVGCKLERSRQTALRLMHEAQLHEYNSFLTLTYSEEFLEKRRREFAKPHRAAGPRFTEGPLSDQDTAHGRETPTHEERIRADSLCKRDLQLFTKRLNESNRRSSARKGIRYYGCGEYGEKLGRPHYHLAVFGEEFSGDRYPWRRSPSGHQLWRSPRLEKLWPHGNAEIGELTFESAAYIARYMMKKITGPKAKEHYQRVDADGEVYWITPEFNVMSRNPGIGKGWMQKYERDVYPHDYVVINGQKCKPPRYYDKLLEALKPHEMEAIKEARAEGALANSADNTAERLAVKETVLKARLTINKRSLE